MPQEPFRPTPLLTHEHWERVATAEEAKRWEVQETVQRPMAAIDYDRAQDERWSKISPRLIEALDKLVGKVSELAPQPPVVSEPNDYELAEYSEYYGHFW